MNISELGASSIGSAHAREVERAEKANGHRHGASASRGPSGEAAVGRVRGAVESSPEIRSELVASLRARIEAGQYQPDLEQLIDRLLGRAR